MRNLEFDAAALEDLVWWIEQDRNKALRIMSLVKDVQRDPFKGIGKPEPLRHELKGCWSRRIDQEHRLIYQVTEEKIRILACRYHY
ncbi:MAG TPA: Txe/YoeB family addiction module toxin [Pyrinomonadaceae bacterium]